MIDEAFEPDWASPPGDTIEDTLQARSMTVDDLAARTGLPAGFLTLLVAGEAILSEDVAVQLERVLGAPAQFWVNRERNFRRDLARQVNKVAAEVLARGLAPKVVSERADLPAPYIEKVFAGTAYYAPWVVEKLQRIVSKPEADFKAAADAHAAAFANFKPRVVGRDHWTEQDRENDRVYRTLVDKAVARRKTALLERGWKTFLQRRHLHGVCAMHAWAIDPLNGREVTEDDAYRFQEQREPGSIEPFPERAFPLPQGGVMFNIPARVEIKPLPTPAAGILYLNYEYKLDK